jgi:hypothetical protein
MAVSTNGELAVQSDGANAIRGSCVCGGVRFEARKVQGPFELCHCSRCRKVTGSAFAAAVYALPQDFKWVQGQELVRVYEAPIVRSPPAYHSCFCSRCGSRVPDAFSAAPLVELPAGCLDTDPGLRPEMHIHIGGKAPWFAISDGLPRHDRAALNRPRAGAS